MTQVAALAPPRQSRLLVRVAAGALVVLAIAPYVPALRAGYIWDDSDYLTSNATVRTLDGLWQIWTHPSANLQFYPLFYTSYWLEYQVWGLNPFGYHLVNLLLHAGSVLVLWRVLLRLRVPGAWAAMRDFIRRIK